MVGTAVPRTDAPEFGRPPVTYLPRYRSYNNLYFPWGYAPFGLGYSWYDPLWWGYDYPYHPGSYGWYRDRDYYDGYGYTGTLRLKVKPRDAQVFTDGYFVGVVDEFDGILQSLKLEAGPHRIEVRLAGFEPLIFDVRIIPGETVTYRGELKPTRQP